MARNIDTQADPNCPAVEQFATTLPSWEPGTGCEFDDAVARVDRFQTFERDHRQTCARCGAYDSCPPREQTDDSTRWRGAIAGLLMGGAIGLVRDAFVLSAFVGAVVGLLSGWTAEHPFKPESRRIGGRHS